MRQWGTTTFFHRFYPLKNAKKCRLGEGEREENLSAQVGRPMRYGEKEGKPIALGLK